MMRKLLLFDMKGRECNYVVDGVPYHLDEGCYMTIPKLAILFCDAIKTGVCE